jgi:hypothetical protein
VFLRSTALLAYSSVEHLGIIVLGAGMALLGALIHLLFNSFGKAALFFHGGQHPLDALGPSCCFRAVCEAPLRPSG